jgi:hypothetical protein
MNGYLRWHWFRANLNLETDFPNSSTLNKNELSMTIERVLEIVHCDEMWIAPSRTGIRIVVTGSVPRFSDFVVERTIWRIIAAAPFIGLDIVQEVPRKARRFLCISSTRISKEQSIVVRGHRIATLLPVSS